jgi:cytochrome c55X
MPRSEIFAIIATAISSTSLSATGTISPERAAELKNLVLQDCGSCHGMTLRGGLGPDIRSHALAGRTPQSIANSILDGVPGTPMPPWRLQLSESDAQWIANYLLKGQAQ